MLSHLRHDVDRAGKACLAPYCSEGILRGRSIVPILLATSYGTILFTSWKQADAVRRLRHLIQAGNGLGQDYKHFQCNRLWGF